MFTRTFTERSRTGNAQVVEVPSVQQVHRKKGTTLHDLSDEVQHKLFLAAVFTKNSQVNEMKEFTGQNKCKKKKKKSIVKEVQVTDFVKPALINFMVEATA